MMHGFIMLQQNLNYLAAVMTYMIKVMLFTAGQGSVGGVNNNEFGNLMIARNAGCTPAVNLTINGNLIINNTASNVVFRAVRSSGKSNSYRLR